MKIARATIQTLAAVVFTLFVQVDEAAAQLPTEQHTVIVVDRSGSMTATRTDGSTRFAEAIRRARNVVSAPMSITRYFAVWSFEGTSYIKEQGFADTTTTLNTLNRLRVGTGVTPLAYAVCDAVDELLAYKRNTGIVASKVLHLVSDGEENSTPSGTQCYGPTSPTDYPNLATGSWEWKVRNKVRTGDANNSSAGGFPVVLDVTVLTNHISLTGDRSPPEVSERGELITSNSVSTLSNYFTFLQGLANASGGSYTPIVDSKPAPVFADTNQDYCVDSKDYNTVMANYGYTVPPANPVADLNLDNVVDYYDYVIVMNNQGQGSGCGVASVFMK